jgi:hypothetical protein
MGIYGCMYGYVVRNSRNPKTNFQISFVPFKTQRVDTPLRLVTGFIVGNHFVDDRDSHLICSSLNFVMLL